MLLFLILFLIHILGDFYFQSDSIAEAKHNRYSALLKHSAIYLLIAVIICIPFFSFSLLFAVTSISVAHYVIDSLKFVYLRKKPNDMQDKTRSRLVYIADQLLHLLSIFVICLVFPSGRVMAARLSLIGSVIQASTLYSLLRWSVLLLVMWKPVNITLKHLLSPYRPEENANTEQNNLRAGAFIGGLERTMMLLLLAVQQYAAIGLVLTAKSIARYSKIQEDKAFAEYYLLGTLLSTLSAIVIFLLI